MVCGFHMPLVSFVVRYFKRNFQQDQMCHFYVVKKYCFVKPLSAFQIHIVRKSIILATWKEKVCKIKYPCKLKIEINDNFYTYNITNVLAFDCFLFIWWILFGLLFRNAKMMHYILWCTIYFDFEFIAWKLIT